MNISPSFYIKDLADAPNFKDMQPVFPMQILEVNHSPLMT